MANSLFLMAIAMVASSNSMAEPLLVAKIQLDKTKSFTIIVTNNTPPASRKISAPRGVTRFWGIEK